MAGMTSSLENHEMELTRTGGLADIAFMVVDWLWTLCRES